MKLILISDLHADLKLGMARLDEGGTTSDRLRDVCGVIDQAVDYAASKNIPKVFILGDLFNVQRPDGATLVAVSQALSRAHKVGVDIHILPGNHDAVDRDGRLYNIQMYDALNAPGIHVLGHESLELTEGVRLHCVPWLPEQRARKRIKSLHHDTRDGDMDWLFIHQTLAGAVGDSGWVSNEGLDGASLEGWSGVFSGHYHKPQKLGDNVMYLGSPLHLTFAEADVVKRGWWVLDTEKPVDKNNPKLVPASFPMFGVDRIQLDVGDVLEDVCDIAESAEGLAYLKMIISGDPVAVNRARATVAAWRTNATLHGLRDIKLEERPTPRQRERLRMDAADVQPGSFKLSSAMGAYVEQYAPEGADKSALRELGTRLLSEARSQG